MTAIRQRDPIKRATFIYPQTRDKTKTVDSTFHNQFLYSSTTLVALEMSFPGISLADWTGRNLETKGNCNGP